MLSIQPATKPGRKNNKKIALAIAGGGPLGAIYELGALRALDEALIGKKIHEFDTFVGVSAGAFIAAALANRMPVAQMVRIFISDSDQEYNFKPEHFLKPAYKEYFLRAGKLPSAIYQSSLRYISSLTGNNEADFLSPMSQLMPSGLFDNGIVKDYFTRIFSAPGRTDTFSELECQLYIIAVDLETGTTVRFGEKGHDDLSISTAVQASSSLPALYPPTRINGRYYVDGALKRTLHASVALDHSPHTLFSINPLVPYKATSEHQPQRLHDGGLPMLLSQTFRSLIHSRMQVAFSKYQNTYPESNLVLFEPQPDDEQMFFTNVFSYASRRSLCEHAYQKTRSEILDKKDQLLAILEPLGLSLDEKILKDQHRNLEDGLCYEDSGECGMTQLLNRTLNNLEQFTQS
ncbi:MAG: patatin-like phospholipase family protein [bacterium]